MGRRERAKAPRASRGQASKRAPATALIANPQPRAYFRAMPRAFSTFLTTCLLGFCVSAFGLDWPQRGGPQHNNISQETGWQAEWSGNGPRELWSAEVGLGFSSFVVANGSVLTTGHAEGQDTVFCLDAVTGKEKWKHSYPSDLGDKFYEGGTSATPT